MSGWLPRFVFVCVLSPGCAHSDGSKAPGAGEPNAPAHTVRSSDTAKQPLRASLLKAHNARRARHCAPPLKWSDELARVAEAWAGRLARRGCPLEHSDTRYGENLAAGTHGGFAPEDFVEMWYREVDQYRFKRAKFSMASGHFTQLVWRSTKRVGCALKTCDNGLDVLVCNYDPAGNVDTLFEANVEPTSCKP